DADDGREDEQGEERPLPHDRGRVRLGRRLSFGHPIAVSAAAGQLPSIFAFWAANSSSVRTPLSRSSPSSLSWAIGSAAGAAGGAGAGGGSACCGGGGLSAQRAH